MTSPAIAPLEPLAQHCPVQLFLRRIWALTLRHVFLYLGSWPRFVETLFWPIVNMLMLGFASLYLLHRFSSATVIASVFISGALLNEVMLRTSMGLMMMFLEEIWSRNLGHMFASPLRLRDYVVGMLGFTFVKTTVSIIPAMVVAIWLFDFSIFSLGWHLPVYMLLLIFSGWSYGLLITSMLLRFGLAAEWVAWMSLWLVVPIMAPYYPVEVLPGWMQIIAHALPATYVFESMKSLLDNGDCRPDCLLKSLILNIVYFAGASLVLYRAYRGARSRGGLLQVGE